MIIFCHVVINKINVGLIYSNNHMLILEKIKATQDYNKDNLGIKVLRNLYTSSKQKYSKE